MSTNDQDRLLDHEYDGIQEYDNPMPGWWKALFWLCILFAGGYWLYYHTFSPRGTPVADEYESELAEAKLAAQGRPQEVVFAPKSEEELAKLMANTDLIAKGAVKYKEVCAACHGDKGEGKIGPNLTDNAWIHGGTMPEVYKTIWSGVLAKGMPAWGKALTPEQMDGVVAYVGSIRGTNVAGKAPQGTVVEAAAAPAGAATPSAEPAAVTPAAAPAAAPAAVPAPTPAP
jgi:cytochrome c oxidase cbb3-type subunit 3